MYIQEQVHYVDLDDDILSFFRSISVNFIHLELRDGGGGKKKRTGANQAHFPLMQRIQAGQDCTNELEQAREQVESQGRKLNNIFMPCWEGVTGDDAGRSWRARGSGWHAPAEQPHRLG